MFATFRTALKSRVVWALCPEIRTSTIQDVTFPASSVQAKRVLTTLARRRCKGPGCPPPDTKKIPGRIDQGTRERRLRHTPSSPNRVSGRRGCSRSRKRHSPKPRSDASRSGRGCFLSDQKCSPAAFGLCRTFGGSSCSPRDRHDFATRHTKALEFNKDSRATRTLSYPRN